MTSPIHCNFWLRSTVNMKRGSKLSLSTLVLTKFISSKLDATIELMANKVNWSRKKSQVSRQIHLFLASFWKLLLSWSRLKWQLMLLHSAFIIILGVTMTAVAFKSYPEINGFVENVDAIIFWEREINLVFSVNV